MPLIQATCVAIDGRAVLITGDPGVGKSSLALALIDRGARLVGDDGVAIDRSGDGLRASPAPETRGLLEIRGVGLIALEPVGAPVGLCVSVGIEGDRLPDRLPETDVVGVPVPTLRLARLDWTSPLRIESALARHGLPRNGTARQAPVD